MRLHLCLPSTCIARLSPCSRQCRQFCQPRVQRRQRRQVQLTQQVVMALGDRTGTSHAFGAIGTFAQLPQRIGHARQRRDHHQHPRTFSPPAGDQLADMLPARHIGDTAAAKLHHDPWCIGSQRCGNDCGHGNPVAMSMEASRTAPERIVSCACGPIATKSRQPFGRPNTTWKARRATPQRLCRRPMPSRCARPAAGGAAGGADCVLGAVAGRATSLIPTCSCAASAGPACGAVFAIPVGSDGGALARGGALVPR